MLPLLVGLTMVMIRVNSAIQASIVNQKYARSFIHFFAFNSPTYPISNAREAYRDNMAASKSNQFVVGIGEDPLPGDQFVSPAAPQIKIAKNRGSRDPQSFPEQTGTVLVRNTVSLCTQPIVVRGPNGLVPVEGGKSGLAESSRFAFCKGVFE